MIAPRRKTVSSLLLVMVGALAGCTSYYEIPIETPIQPKLDTSQFQRVFVAGFVAGGNDDIDGNLETVRLLRSQLRQKGALRVVESEPLALTAIATEELGIELPPPAAGAATSDPAADDAPATGIREERDLEPFDKFFEKTDYWKKIGDEHQGALIVTGTVLFRPHTTSGFVQREQETYDEFGRRRVTPQRVYMERSGYILRPTFVFIDGRTGETLHTETFREEILYNQNTQTPALSSFFELMDRLLPSFLNSMTSQKIRGTRVLLK
jgi:hypothetical protein